MPRLIQSSHFILSLARLDDCMSLPLGGRFFCARFVLGSVFSLGDWTVLTEHMHNEIIWGLRRLGGVIPHGGRLPGGPQPPPRLLRVSGLPHAGALAWWRGHSPDPVSMHARPDRGERAPGCRTQSMSRLQATVTRQGSK